MLLLLVVPVCARRFQRHYSGQPALLNCAIEEPLLQLISPPSPPSQSRAQAMPQIYQKCDPVIRSLPLRPPSIFRMSGFGRVLKMVFRVTLPTTWYSTLSPLTPPATTSPLPPPIPASLPLPPPSGLLLLQPGTMTFRKTRRGLGSDATFPSNLW